MGASFSDHRPIRHAIVVAHPDRNSFNLAVAARYAETVVTLGHRVVTRDLYRLHFDPILKADERPTAEDFMLDGDVAAELDQLQGVDVLVFVYPLWFGLPPAILKGYVERVLGAGFSFRALRDATRHPLLTGKRLVSFTSSGTGQPFLEESGAWTSLKTIFDDYLRRAFSMESTEHVHFASIDAELGAGTVQGHLRTVENTARRLCAAAPSPTLIP